jgi:predicted phage terminase large subunit-like protein
MSLPSRTNNSASSPADPALILRARAELELRRRERLTGPLQGFIPAVTPRWSEPRHLRRLTDQFERIARGERVQVLVSVPPQHGKTETLLHALAWLLRKRPDLRNAYASYAASLAFTKSRLARDYAQRAGVQLRDDASRVSEWVTTAGGGLLATGVGGPLTGNPVDGVLLIDDPHKNRAEAESATIRATIQEWWTSTALTRVHPSASIVVVHTRWHPDDLIGWLQDRDGARWETIALRAIADGTDPDDPRAEGEALWPEFMPADFLAERRVDVGEYDWASLYDQRPRPKGGAVFSGDVRFGAPPGPYRVAIGLDLAYTEKTSSDYSVAVVMAECRGDFYLLDLHRMQAPAPAFAERLRGLVATYPGARLFSFIGGTERGVVDLLNTMGLRIETKPSVGDKFVKAQPVAAAWNAGRIFLPKTSPAWINPLVSELRVFTGLKDRHDDQVDALGSAYEILHRPPADTSVLHVRTRR